MQPNAQATTSPYRWWIRGVVIVFIIGVLTLAVVNLPRGFETDLSNIGDGKPALVFVYDSNLVVSSEQTREMDLVREELPDTLHFLLADIGRPEAQKFMQDHQATPAQLLLFSADGNLLHRAQSLMSAEQLRILLSDFFIQQQ